MILRQKYNALWYLAFLSLFWDHSNATIKIVESGHEYRSWPDRELGLRMIDDTVYKARLQQIKGNSHLCFTGQNWNWNVTVPDDGLPGTFFRSWTTLYIDSSILADLTNSPPK